MAFLDDDGVLDLVVAGVFAFVDEPFVVFSLLGVFATLTVDFGVLDFVVFVIEMRRGVFVG